MTMKTKRGLVVGGGTILCAALAILIATQFAPDEKQTATSTPSIESKPAISVEISTPKSEDTKPIEIEKPEINSAVTLDNSVSDKANTESDPEMEAASFIEDGGIEIEQNFPEPEKETEQNEPPAPPQIEDEEMLTNPDKEPTYEPEQVEVNPQTETPTNPNINPAMHGQRKDGLIFINGFGWVVDEGGGGIGEAAPDMYQNGNKIGYFG